MPRQELLEVQLGILQEMLQKGCAVKRATYMGIKGGLEADQRVFMMDPPLDGNEFVCVSATTMNKIARLANSYGVNLKLEPETYIFACDAAGFITNYGELEGSYRGGMNHAQALMNAGYEIVEKC